MLLLVILPSAASQAADEVTVSGTTRGPLTDDWYGFTAAPNSPLSVQVRSTPCAVGWHPLVVELWAGLGGQPVGAMDLAKPAPAPISTTTAGQAATYYIRLRYGCQLPYTVALAPAGSVLSTPATVTQPLFGERNQTRYLAYGPLLGGVMYDSIIEVEEDVDWFTFFADGAFQINAIGNGVSLQVHDDAFRRIATTAVGNDSFSRIDVPAAGWRQYFVAFSGQTEEFPHRYMFVITGADSIRSTAAPGLRPPAALTGLKARRGPRLTTLTWQAAARATLYEYRVKAGQRWGNWRRAAGLRITLKESGQPRTVQIRPGNAAGAGPISRIVVPTSR
jgi:hypothetical protein